MKRQPIQIDFSTLSMDTQAAPIEAECTHLSDCLNVYNTTRGTWRTRPGFSLIGNAPPSNSPVDGEFSGVINVTDSVTLKVVGGSLFRLQGTTWVSLVLPANALLFSGVHVNFAVFQNFVVFGNGITDNLKYDGSTVTPLSSGVGSLEPAKYFVAHGTRLFAAGIKGFASRFKWSTDNSATSWDNGVKATNDAVAAGALANTAAEGAALAAGATPANAALAGEAAAVRAYELSINESFDASGGFKDVEVGAGEIIGIASHNLDLYVFKGIEHNQGVFLFSGTSDDDFSFRPLARGITGFHRSLLNTLNDLLFCGPNGVYSVNRLRVGATIEQSRISSSVHSLFTPFPDSISSCCAVYWKTENLALFFIRTLAADELNLVLCLSFPAIEGDAYQWSYWRVSNVKIAIEFLDTLGSRRLLIGRADGSSDISDLGKDTDTSLINFPAYLRTTSLHYGNERVLKGIRFLSLNRKEVSDSIRVRIIPSVGIGDVQFINVDPLLLWNAAGAVWNSANLWPILDLSSTGVPLSGYFTRAIISIEKVTRNFEIYSMQLDFTGGGADENDK